LTCLLEYAILLLVAFPLYAQTDSLHFAVVEPFFVDTIIVSGNEKTKDYVILDEMTIKPWTIATPALIEFDKQRIYSLSLFTHVEILGDTLGGKHLLIVELGERWFLIPQVIFGFRDGDPKKPYYGGGFLENNFKGRNQKLSGAIIFGYNPSIGFSFRDPLIDRDHRLFFSSSISYSRIRNKSAIESEISGDFDEDHYNANITLGKRFTLFESFAVNLGLDIVQIDSYSPERTASPDGKDAYIYAAGSYANDTRDLREYPASGYFVNFFLTKYGFGESAVSYSRFGTDLRTYIPLPFDFTIAGRTYGSFAFGTFVPSYGRAFFGYGEKIRGYYNDVIEGDDLVGATVEVHWPLLPSRTIHFTAINLPEAFSFWRFGISLALFADAGTAWFRGTPVSFNSFASGYGGGVHFLLPYSVLMRVEYAWNDYGDGQFILDFRTSI
jgi:outer membrane protein assembly factor BamA